MNKREILEQVKREYDDLYDDIIVATANGNLQALVNLRSEFDETFDEFFDSKEIRIKYDGFWITEEESDEYYEADTPNADYSNAQVEAVLDDEDVQKLIEFYQYHIALMHDDYRELCEDEVEE